MDSASMIYHMEGKGSSNNKTRNTSNFTNKLLSETHESKLSKKGGYPVRRFSA